jgi:hypothetical protein
MASVVVLPMVSMMGLSGSMSRVLVSWVSVAPSAVMPCSFRASRIGSPMPVWSMRSFWSLNCWLMRFVVLMTSV